MEVHEEKQKCPICSEMSTVLSLKHPMRPSFQERNRRHFNAEKKIKVCYYIVVTITNIIDFGAFVDLEVGKNGMIHSIELNVSEKVECKV